MLRIDRRTLKKEMSYDLQNDPSEMKSEYSNPEYAPEIERLKKELLRLREQYKVPAAN